MDNKLNITSAKYLFSDSDTITIVVDGQELHVPNDMDNIHRAEIKRQVDAGELTIEDAE